MVWLPWALTSDAVHTLPCSPCNAGDVCPEGQQAFLQRAPNAAMPYNQHLLSLMSHTHQTFRIGRCSAQLQADGSLMSQRQARTAWMPILLRGSLTQPRIRALTEQDADIQRHRFLGLFWRRVGISDSLCYCQRACRDIHRCGWT